MASVGDRAGPLLYPVGPNLSLESEIPPIGELQVSREEAPSHLDNPELRTPLCWKNEEQRCRVDSLAKALKAWGDTLNPDVQKGNYTPKPERKHTIIWVKNESPPAMLPKGTELSEYDGGLGHYKYAQKPREFNLLKWDQRRLERAQVYKAIMDDLDQIKQTIGLRRFLYSSDASGALRMSNRSTHNMVFGLYNLRHDMLDRVFTKLRCNPEDYGVAKANTNLLSHFQSRCVRMLAEAARIGGVNMELDQISREIETYNQNYAVWRYTSRISPDTSVQFAGRSYTLDRLLHSKVLDDHEVEEVLRQLGLYTEGAYYANYIANRRALLQQHGIDPAVFMMVQYDKRDWLSDGQSGTLRELLEGSQPQDIDLQKVAKQLNPDPVHEYVMVERPSTTVPLEPVPVRAIPPGVMCEISSGDRAVVVNAGPPPCNDAGLATSSCSLRCAYPRPSSSTNSYVYYSSNSSRTNSRPRGCSTSNRSRNCCAYSLFTPSVSRCTT